MAGSFVDYYVAVADRMVPFLRGRKVVVEQRFREGEEPVYRRHEGTGGERRWIAIDGAEDVVRRARQRAVAFHAHLKPEGAGCWFVLDVDARERPLAMAQLAARHALDVLEGRGLRALTKFSGANGFHLMWDVPDLRGLGRRTVWDLEREVVEAVARQVASRLAVDPAAEPLRAAVGPTGRVVATNSQDEATRAGLLFDKNILKPNVNVRVPYSIHPASGLVAVPLDRAALDRFGEGMAEPSAVEADPGRAVLPRNELADVKRALDHWTT